MPAGPSPPSVLLLLLLLLLLLPALGVLPLPLLPAASRRQRCGAGCIVGQLLRKQTWTHVAGNCVN
jgi:hypothetical protein